MGRVRMRRGHRGTEGCERLRTGVRRHPRVGSSLLGHGARLAVEARLCSACCTPPRGTALTEKSALPATLEWDDARRPGGRHGPRPGDGRGAEGRQRPPRHGHEPGPGGVPALPEGHAARPRRPASGSPATASCSRAATAQHHPLHPALPRRLRPRARRPQGAAHLGLQDPRPPRARPHRRRRGDDRARSARASATPSAWPCRVAACTACSTPTPPPARASSTTRSTPSRSDGDLEEGVSSEASLDRRHPEARQPHPHLRPQPDLDRGRHRHRVHRGRRRALRGLRLARPDRRLDQRRQRVRRGRPGALRRDPQGPRRRPTSPR